ncbi:MAG: helix-turn-helix domain-containing protein [Bacteroidia bacterium]|nr:helix-turn-helix domain-containing protein [Bacteroidia bacterium]
MSINKRVVQLIEKTSVSKAAFSEATGISTVILSHISSGRNKVSLTAVEQILKAFSNVSAKWLIFGQGSMFESQDDISKYNELDKQLNRLKSDVEFYNNQLGEQVTILQKLLKKLKDD